MDIPLTQQIGLSAPVRAVDRYRRNCRQINTSSTMGARSMAETPILLDIGNESLLSQRDIHLELHPLGDLRGSRIVEGIGRTRHNRGLTAGFRVEGSDRFVEICGWE